ncbi:DUF1307 domain-containing protein [Vagococcus fluvialis]|uniref:DUF1307 domain-containing protein n=1 Tax=Vagococcus fluvialis TaxID=2738 RepID=UPI003796A423
MKKYLKMILFVVVTLILVSCSQNLETKTFYLNSEGNKIQITYEFKDGKAVKQSTKNEILYKNLDIKTKEEAIKLIASTEDLYKGSGIKHEVEYNDEYLTEKIDVDYDKLSTEDMNELVFITEGESKKNLTKKNIKDKMINLGFSENELDSSQEEITKYNKIVKNFKEVSVKDIQSLEKEIVLFVGYAECPYCRIFAPKLLEASKNENKEIYYLNTNNLSDTEEENKLLKSLNLETVPALFNYADNKIKTFEFEDSENVSVKDIQLFFKEND